MNKFGFATHFVCLGSGEPTYFNKDECWWKEVGDRRNYLNLFDNAGDLTFLSFVREGCFLTCMKRIDGRVGDYASAWIFIPCDIDATASDVMNAYRYAKGLLDHADLEPLRSEIEGFFGKAYPHSCKPIPNVPAIGSARHVAAMSQPQQPQPQPEKYAYRYYDKEVGGMESLLGELRFQDYYSPYKAVFLLDSALKPGQKEHKSMTDLTERLMEQRLWLRYPSKEELEKLGINGGLKFKDTKEAFRKDVVVLAKKQIQLVASRKGFDDYEIPSFTIEKSEETLPCHERLPWKKTITEKDFIVQDEYGDRISFPDIKVNGKEARYGKEVKEADCKKVHLVISAIGRETVDTELDFSDPKRHTITMKKEKKTIIGKIELGNGLEGDFTVSSRDLPLNGPLLKGYEYDEFKKVYVPSWWYATKHKLIGAAILVGLFVGYSAYGEVRDWCASYQISEWKYVVIPVIKKVDSQGTVPAQQPADTVQQTLPPQGAAPAQQPADSVRKITPPPASCDTAACDSSKTKNKISINKSNTHK